jgi:hypothetical protein
LRHIRHKIQQAINNLELQLWVQLLSACPVRLEVSIVSLLSNEDLLPRADVCLGSAVAPHDISRSH